VNKFSELENPKYIILGLERQNNFHPILQSCATKTLIKFDEKSLQGVEGPLTPKYQQSFPIL